MKQKELVKISKYLSYIPTKYINIWVASMLDDEQPK